MADNTTLSAGSGGDTIAADDISSVKYQRVKLIHGADGVNDGDVSTANGLPIKGTGTAGTANAGVVTVQGVASMTPVQVGDNSGSLTVDNGGTFPVQVDGTALTRLTDIETNTDSNAVVGNGAALTAQRVTLANDSTGVIATVAAVTAITNALPAGTNAIGKLAANSGVDIGDVDVTSIAAGDNNIGNVDIVTVPADPFGTNADAASATGSISAKLRSIAATGIPITGTVTVGSHAVTNAGTFATQSAGDVAHDSADSGAPVKQGAKASTALSALTLVADADRTNLHAGVDGVQIVRPHCNLEDIVSGNANNTDGASTQCIAAQASGIKTYLTSVILTNTSSSNIYVEIKDGTTVKVTIPLPANSGAIFNPPVPLPGTAATAWNFDPSAAATTVYASFVGFKSKV